MSEAAVTQRGTRAPGDDRAFAPAGWPAPDSRRRLQIAGDREIEHPGGEIDGVLVVIVAGHFHDAFLSRSAAES